MNRRTVTLQLIVFGVISALIVGYTLFSLLGIKIVNRPFTVTMRLPTGGGIFTGAEVAYRGVAVGRVSATQLRTDGVTLTLKLNHGTRVPARSTAHVYDLSAVGEQYVDLVPPAGADGAGYLHAGSVIPASRTTTPAPLSDVLYHAEQLISSLNPTDLQTLTREGARAFAGTGPQLASILANTRTVLAELSASQDAASRLLDNSATLLDGARAHAADFDTFASSLRALSATLAGSTPTVEKLLRQAGPTTRLLEDVLSQNTAAVTTLLANLTGLSRLQAARIPALRAVLRAVPEFGRRVPSISAGNALTTVLNFNLHSPLCPSGLPLTNPISGTRTPLHAVGCVGLPRGAANAPRPAGDPAPDTASWTRLLDPGANG